MLAKTEQEIKGLTPDAQGTGYREGGTEKRNNNFFSSSKGGL
jgi:hypothetical protein